MSASGSIVIFGATSGIAREVSREFTRRGEALVLVGRDGAALRAEADDLTVRGSRECSVFEWDLLDRERHAQRFAALVASAGARGLRGVFFAPGIMPSEEELRNDADLTRRTLDLNFTETVIVLNLFAEFFRAQGAGFLSVLSSVAGDRGRAGNKTYGASKAGLTAYLEGLRASLRDSGVKVQTVKPGPVRTPMTAGYKGPALLLAEPGTVARDIVRGLERGRSTVYTPGYWKWIMRVIRALPESIAGRIKA